MSVAVAAQVRGPLARPGGPAQPLAMDDDLEMLVGLAGGDVAGVEAAEAADVEMLVALARPPAPAERRHPQRSWQLCEKARAAKKAKAMEKKVAEADSARHQAESSLVALSTLCPAAAARLKIAQPRREMDDQRAEIVAALALSPTVPARDALTRTHRRAVSLLTETALQVQSEYCGKVFGAALELAAPGASSASSGLVCVCLTWQWDETTQKIRNALGPQLRGEKRSDARVASQSLMQSGRVIVYESLAAGGFCLSAPEPILCRGTFLQSTSADMILEAILKRYPLPLDDAEAMAAALSGDSLLLLTFAHDRASANFVALRWLFQRVALPSLPKTVFAHAEACVLHGLQLARTRPAVGKTLVGATFSLTRFLRSWRSRESLRAELIALVRSRLLVDSAALEQSESEQQQAALNILFGADGAAEGSRKNPLREDVRLLLDLVSLHPTVLKHHCPRASAAERARGGPAVIRCCDAEGEAVEKVTVAVLNALLPKAWVVGSESRWTHTLRVLARFVLGCLLGGILPAALDATRAFAGASPDFESQLAAMVAQQLGDPNSDASRKLRLVRICKALCDPAAGWQAAVMVTGLRLIDDFMYHIFGADAAERPTLLDVLDNAPLRGAASRTVGIATGIPAELVVVGAAAAHW